MYMKIFVAGDGYQGSGNNLENYFWIGLVGAILALLFAYIQSRKVLAYSEGTEQMQKISSAIRAGANAYLKRQYKTVAKFFVVMVIVFAVLAAFGLVSPVVPFSFVTGGFYSSLAGFIGMKIATSANARTTNAAHESLNKGLNVAFSSGSVMGFTVVGLGMLDISIWFHVLRYLFHASSGEIAQTMVMFGIGASSAALFARVAAASSPRLPTWAPIWWARLRPESPKTTPATPPSSPTTWATTWATWPHGRRPV
jgi:K(+)-stimulated pyrophosphate-energized sodium pump